VTLTESLLWPLALPFGVAVRLRALAYRKRLLRTRRVDGIVISVGNLTVGGTGKTPMVLWIAERLLAEGKRVGILTRGYRGEPSGAQSNHASGAAADSTSDEVQLLKSRLGDRVAFGVGRNRFTSGRELARRGIQWFILDDGFQHQQLARDVDVVLIDATNPFGGGHLLPAGRLREPKSALARADIVVITRTSRAPAIEAAVRRESNAPIFYARPQLDSIQKISDGQSGSAVADGQLPKLFAFCGIGNPSAFLASLRDWNIPIVGHKFFPDHHRYTQKDDDEMARLARLAGASGVICTEKDVYNLHGIYHRLKTFYCSISMRVDREDDFWQAVVSAAKSRAHSPQIELPLGE
jgi:tetraacyldisaccharide 4'-kinase